MLVVGCYKITQRDILTDRCVQNGGFLAVTEKSLELLIFTCAFFEKGSATSHYSGGCVVDCVVVDCVVVKKYFNFLGFVCCWIVLNKIKSNLYF